MHEVQELHLPSGHFLPDAWPRHFWRTSPEGLAMVDGLAREGLRPLFAQGFHSPTWLPFCLAFLGEFGFVVGLAPRNASAAALLGDVADPVAWGNAQRWVTDLGFEGVCQ